MKDKGELQALKTELSRGGRQVMLLSETDSTNRVAKAWAMENPGRRAVVMADRQTAGRGRLGRKWCSAEGNLYISFVYEAPLPPEQLSALTLAAAMAADDTVQALGAKSGIKWPNDIYAGGKKLVGILCEGVLRGGCMASVVVGIGINVRQTEFESEVADVATSLALLTEKDHTPMEVACLLAEKLDARVEQFFRGGFAAMREEYTARSILLGRPVSAAVPQPVEGICVGFSPEGDLLLKTQGGTLPVRTGEVVGKLGFKK
ncbi:MAG: biotin--[Christensenellaceae bacterium]|nr:biotin--[acetyl-CoA-carboxylase] ligase [Christensenellaceae bacterium]